MNDLAKQRMMYELLMRNAGQQAPMQLPQSTTAQAMTPPAQLGQGFDMEKLMQVLGKLPQGGMFGDLGQLAGMYQAGAGLGGMFK